MIIKQVFKTFIARLYIGYRSIAFQNVAIIPSSIHSASQWPPILFFVSCVWKKFCGTINCMKQPANVICKYLCDSSWQLNNTRLIDHYVPSVGQNGKWVKNIQIKPRKMKAVSSSVGKRPSILEKKWGVLRKKSWTKMFEMSYCITLHCCADSLKTSFWVSFLFKPCTLQSSRLKNTL